MELRIEIAEVDYASVADKLLPIAEEKLDSGKFGFLLFGKTNPLRQAAAIIQKLPQEKKDSLLSIYVNRNREKIARKLEQFALEQGVAIRIEDISLN